MSPDAEPAAWTSRHALVLSPTPTHPLDAGNRKRIYEVCRTLRDRGSKITFLHYPAEDDWRGAFPLEDNRAMQSQWDAYFVSPVSRSLHEHSRAADHTIDEWWDPAIGDMLRWLFRGCLFDTFIVNYAWLSKAFEFCPPHVLKILDTHDRLSGRRELLAEYGIKPEFFHLTESEEAIALNRADVVWSIKPHEAEIFRSLTSRVVLNLPFVEPLERRVTAERDPRIIRFGMIGAANSINQINIEAFLDAAEDYVRRTLLPCEFWIAGSCCEVLRNRGLSYIRYIGRVRDTAEFYTDVDVVLAPITFSTGLKIKVGEALCAGKAVIAHEHAFEGYHALHEFHSLPSIGAMLRACRAVVAMPSLIRELEGLAVQSVSASRVDYLDAIDTTFMSFWRTKRGTCLIVAAAELYSGSIVLDHLIECSRYLRHLSSIVIVVDGGLEWLEDDRVYERLQGVGLLLTTQPPEGSDVPRLSRLHVTYRDLGDILEDGHFAYWFASRPTHFPTASPRRQRLAYIALDAFVCGQHAMSSRDFVREIGACFSEVVVVRRRQMEIVAECAEALAQRHYFAPLLWRGEDSVCVRAIRAADRNVVTLLIDDPTDPLVGLCLAVIRHSCSNPIELVVSPDGKRAAPDACKRAGQFGSTAETVGFVDYLRTRGSSKIAPWVVLDLSLSSAFDGLREVFERARVPVAELFAAGGRPAHGHWTPPTSRSGVFESVNWLQALLREKQAAATLIDARDESRNYSRDPGWCRVWQDLSRVIETTY